MRPQLASSPAIAVFTSGELAIESATRLAERGRRRPGDVDAHQLAAPPRRPAPPAAPGRAADRPAPIGTRAAAAPPSAGTRGCLAWPVANSSTVSEVEVSESTVMQLKLPSTARPSSVCSAGAGSFASVNTKQSMVAMSGAIMPLPLQKPWMVTSASPMRAVRIAPLGKVSVVMMPRAAASQASSPSAACSPGSAAVSFSSGSTSPITPVEASMTSRGRQPTSPAAALGGGPARLGAGAAGEHVGVAGIHHQRARPAALQRRAAPVDRRAGALVAGEHAGDGGARRPFPPSPGRRGPIADARGGGAKAHAGQAAARQAMRRQAAKPG